MRMFISQDLRQALLISLIWHLFCISFVSVGLTPTGLQPKQHFLVSHLGSILKEPFLSESVETSAKTELVKLPVEAQLATDENYFKGWPDVSVQEEKAVIHPDSFVGVDGFKKVKPVFADLPKARPGQKEREVIFRPEFPQYPEWVQQDFRASFIVFNVYVSAEGLVEELICLQASGNPEIDATLARYIERWRFAPVSSQQGEWQKVKIDLQTNG